MVRANLRCAGGTRRCARLAARSSPQYCMACGYFCWKRMSVSAELLSRLRGEGVARLGDSDRRSPFGALEASRPVTIAIASRTAALVALPAQGLALLGLPGFLQHQPRSQGRQSRGRSLVGFDAGTQGVGRAARVSGCWAPAQLGAGCYFLSGHGVLLSAPSQAGD